MNMVSIIEKKKQGEILTQEEISYVISEYTQERLPDYQVSAWLMAIWFQGMNRQETLWLTEAMRYSGDVVDLSPIHGIKVDKHSTGGVGDKTSLIVGPLVAAAGVPVPKMSGRGLGFTGGTIDKLESIPGFQTSLPEEEFITLVNRVGLSIIGQTAHITPADKKLYALRDVTATVDHSSLIAASIMSKKLASGSDAIVLDVKCGNGAFMETLEDARKLARILVEIGRDAGKNTVALITDMSQPLGNTVGNGNEIWEAIQTLKGEGPEDLTELALALAGMMIFVGQMAKSPVEGSLLAKKVWKNGAALKKFRDFVEGQGGNGGVIEDSTLLPQPAYREKVMGPSTPGYVTEISARQIGMASQTAGAGRRTKEEEIDLSAGIRLFKKTGDSYQPGEPLAEVCGNHLEKVKQGALEAAKAFAIGVKAPEKAPIVKEIIT
jgi:pyrimidine-nucleoside phosphorylase